MDSIIAWIGGKKSLCDTLIPMFPAKYERYIEVFGGGGWLLFKKQPESFEVYNDFNGDLVNLFRVVRECPDDLIAAFDYDLHSRAELFEAKEKLKSRTYKDDLERAYLFYKINMSSFSHNMDTFATKPRSLKLGIFKDAAKRLSSVAIENRDFEELIKIYDRPESFFYCDPPYYGTEDMYQNINFTRETHERLRDCLTRIEGRFLLSYNDCEEIRQLYDRPGFYIQTASRMNNMGTGQYAELIISNYDTNENKTQITF